MKTIQDIARETNLQMVQNFMIQWELPVNYKIQIASDLPKPCIESLQGRKLASDLN